MTQNNRTVRIVNNKILKEKKEKAAIENNGKTPELDNRYVCLTCGNPGLSHPVTSYCFLCGEDNWESAYKIKNRFEVIDTINRNPVHIVTLTIEE